MAQTIPRLLSLDSRPGRSAPRWHQPAPSAAGPSMHAATAHRAPGRRMPRLALHAWLAALLWLLAGCGATPEPRPGPPPVGTATPSPSSPNANAHPEVDAARGEFTTPASMLDTWNAVGQILVRLDGVGYEGRAQMLGIYAVRYRGERLLVVTRALVMRSRAQGMSTKVGATWLDGKPSGSAAAVELLGLLQRRLPAELARIEAGGGPSARHRARCTDGLAHDGRRRAAAAQCPGREIDPPRFATAVAAAPGVPRASVSHPR